MLHTVTLMRSCKRCSTTMVRPDVAVMKVVVILSTSRIYGLDRMILKLKNSLRQLAITQMRWQAISGRRVIMVMTGSETC